MAINNDLNRKAEAHGTFGIVAQLLHSVRDSVVRSKCEPTCAMSYCKVHRLDFGDDR